MTSNSNEYTLRIISAREHFSGIGGALHTQLPHAMKLGEKKVLLREVKEYSITRLLTTALDDEKYLSRRNE